jgi:hypothetical protein
VKIAVDISTFSLPNYLVIGALGSHGKVDVGRLSDREASEYWDAMKVEWMKHVQKRRDIPQGPEDEVKG